jgi:DNA-binding NarL/FixJ family response regulator
LADDHTLFVEAFAESLRPDFDVMGITCNRQTLIETAVEPKPEVITIDLWLPVLNGLDAC